MNELFGELTNDLDLTSLLMFGGADFLVTILNE